MKTADDVWNEVEVYAEKLISHAASRIHDDGTALDERQKAMKEAGEQLLAWAKWGRASDRSKQRAPAE